MDKSIEGQVQPVPGRVNPLTLAVTATAFLLCAGAFLVVLGIFNETLRWDIFSPRVEAVLWGVFFSSVTLGCFGAVLSSVLGIHRIAGSIRDLGPGRSGPEPRRRRYVAALLWLAVLMALVVAACAAANYLVLNHRTAVFTRVAAGQMEHLGPKLARSLQGLSAPPRDRALKETRELLSTLNGLSFVNRAELFLPDPADDSALWKFRAGGYSREEPGPQRFFIARESDRAVKLALEGDPGPLDELNRRRDFIRCFVVTDDRGTPAAVIRIEGNPRENFRDYPL
ncbi:MAG: hypothetical protein P9M08_01785 [Candidatus Erginobacter occultus]|nr:hypothetical protein [Candidatus Erginobacter occultus]